MAITERESELFIKGNRIKGGVVDSRVFLPVSEISSPAILLRHASGLFEGIAVLPCHSILLK